MLQPAFPSVDMSVPMYPNVMSSEPVDQQYPCNVDEHVLRDAQFLQL
jgi:hypothetical protein